MKVQIQLQSLRVRIDEDELARLLDGGTLRNDTCLPGGPVWSLAIALDEAPHPALHAAGEAPLLLLPRSAVLALQARLPCREGLLLGIDDGPAPLQLRFDVDVRDSLRQRGPLRGRQPAPSATV